MKIVFQIVILFSMLIFFSNPLILVSLQTDVNLALNNPIPTAELNDIKEALTITTPNQDNLARNLFALWKIDTTELPTLIGDYLVSMDNEGNILKSFNDEINKGIIPADVIMAPEFINSTTVYFQLSYNSSKGSLLLFNLENGKKELLPIPAGHHDVEYNPATDTFLTMQEAVYGSFGGLQILYDDLYEFDREGNVVWYWNMSRNIPFDRDLYLNETYGKSPDQVYTDWSHGNSIFWDISDNAIYYNSRNLDAFYKINYNSGEIEWKAGKEGDFTLIDEKGDKRDALWFHSHALEKISDTNFIMFDNDYYNLSNGDPNTGRSRYLEINVNEVDMIITYEWDWVAPQEYFIQPFGDADRLPNGNTLGVFGFWQHPTYITEVDPNGEIVWEAKFEPLNEGTIRWGVYRIERYYTEPLIDNVLLEKVDGNEQLTFNVWDTIRRRTTTKGQISIVALYKNSNESIFEKSFDFKPYWQTNTLTLDLDDRFDELIIIVTNADGISSKFTIERTGGFFSRLDLFALLPMLSPIVIIVILKKLKSSN